MGVSKVNKLKDFIHELCPNGVEYKKLADCCVLEKGNTPIQKAIPGEFPLVVTTEERKSCNTYQFDNPTVCIPLVSSRGHGVASLNRLYYQEGKFALGNILCGVTPINSDELSAKFLFYYLNHKKDTLIVPLMRGGANVSLTVDSLRNIKIPVPPISVQEELVYILDKFEALSFELTAELAARKKQYKYYRDSLFRFDDKYVEWTTLDQISKNCDRQRKPVTKDKRVAGKYPYYGASGIVDYVDDYIFDGDYLLVSEDGANLLARSTPIAFSISGKNWVNNHAHVLKFDSEELRRYVETYLNSVDLSKYISGAAQPKLNKDNLNRIPIPVLNSEEMRYMVNVLDQFDALCHSNSEGLPAEIEARQKQYEFYCDKLLTFKQLP
ncbi:MAG: restriction endonuclease subunit S [Clostridia bacterium]|nr:restriction endonuclease subunit S [Clostridia bacterium]